MSSRAKKQLPLHKNMLHKRTQRPIPDGGEEGTSLHYHGGRIATVTVFPLKSGDQTKLLFVARTVREALESLAAAWDVSVAVAEVSVESVILGDGIGVYLRY
jgi:hypothetical protein